MNKREIGSIGEQAAAKMLEFQGYINISRNYRCSYGEIDIVAENEESICFIEVKMRTSCIYGRPCEAVSRKKQERIRKAAVHYLKERKQSGHSYKDIRFDVMEIYINHMKGVF